MGFLFVNAQEETTAADVAAADAQATELAEQDQNVTPEDLGVGDPNILPGNPLYAFKNVRRGFQSFFTFDPAAKAELKLKFASEKIIEAKKLEEGGASDERVKSAIENYEKETGRIKVRIENLKDSGKTKEEIELVVKRAADSQIKHHKALGKFMQKRDDIAPEIEAAKAAAMKQFSESMAAVVEPEVLQQKFEQAIKEQGGSSFRQFNNITVLEEVKDFVPLAARGAIQNAIENSSKAFAEEFQNTSEEQRKIFNKYAEKMGGNEVRHLEAFDDLNAFGDIQKDMFQEMEKAREKTRERIGKRMAGIKDETRKQVFIAHLEDGKLEDARIVKELETNLDPNTITAVLGIKRKMEQKMREKFENAETTSDLNNFFKEIENFSDVQMMQTLTEMEGIIPADKKGFFQEMKKKAMTEMQGEIEKAREFGRVEDKMRMLAGFDPEHMAVLDGFEKEFGPQFTFFDDIRREQSGRIQGRFEQFLGEEDFLKKTEEFRLRIQSDPDAQAQIRQFAPQIDQQFTKFDAQKAQANVSRENLDETVKKAEELVQKLSQKLAETGDDIPGKNAAQQLYNNASSRLADVTLLVSQGKTGEAFGQANSATHLASNGLRKLENEAFKEERKEYFGERDKFREQFRDLPASERPDPSQFLEFKPTLFPTVEPSHGVAPSPSSRAGEKARPISDRKQEGESVFCAQVLTPARHKITGKCVTFPSSCVPPGWEPAGKCEASKEVPIFKEFKFRNEFEERKFEEQERVLPADKQDLPADRQVLPPTPTPTPAPSPIDAEFFKRELQKLEPVPAPIPAFEQQKTISPVPTPAPTPVPTSDTTQKLPISEITIQPITIQPITTQPAPTTQTAPAPTQ